MSTLSCSTDTAGSHINTGTSVDDGAPFSAIGMTELRLLRHLNPSSPVPLDPIPSSMYQYKWWKFGSGKQSSAKRLITGSVNVTVMTDNNNTVRIIYLVLQGSSQWVVGKNASRASDGLHHYCSGILMPSVNGFRD